MLPLVRQRSGFTLIEILVVAAIIAVLSAIAFVSVSQARQNARIKKETLTVESFKLYMRLYQETAHRYPAGDPTLAFNSDHDGDNCSMCYLRHATYGTDYFDTTPNRSIARQEWQAAATALSTTGITPGLIVQDEWGNPYAFDNNLPPTPDATLWSVLCSMGPDGLLQSTPILRTNPSPHAASGSDDICVYF